MISEMMSTTEKIALEQRVRDLAQFWVEQGDADTLEFYDAALACGAGEEVADELATMLNERVMRARGAI